MQWLNEINWTLIFWDWGFILLKLVIISLIFVILKAIGKRAIANAFQKRMQKKEDLSGGRMKTLQSITQNVFTYFLLFIFVGIVFELFGLDIKALLAGAGIVGLAIGFGAQGLVSDIVTGFFILLEKQMDVDDYVTVAGRDGIIEEIGLRTTKIRGFDGTLHYLPNRDITSVSNHSRGNMRALVDIAIASGNDVDRAIQILQDACDRLAKEEAAILEGPHVIGVESISSSEVVIRIICKTKNMEQWAVERKLRKVLKEEMDKHQMELS